MSITFSRPDAGRAIALDERGTSDIAALVDAKIKDLVKALSSASAAKPQAYAPRPATLEGKLTAFSSDFKIYLSSVSMHLPQGWQEGLSRQIDSLVDVDEWDKRDEVPSIESGRTLIRLLMYMNATKRPGLGVSPMGNLVAAWSAEKDRLTIECMANDHVKWVLSKNVGGEIERGAGELSTQRLRAVLDPYQLATWFAHG